MRILIANYEFPPIGGGASKVSFELARTLVHQGHDVLVLTSRHGTLPASETVDGITVHRVWSWRYGIHDCGIRGAITFLLSALPALRRILNRDDIDVVHYFFGLPTGLLSLYSHGVRGIPYIVSLRGSDVPLYDLKSHRLVSLHRVMRQLSHRIWRDASAVFAVSKGLRDLAKKSFPDIDIDVVYNGARVTGSGEPERETDGELRLVCVARLIPRKGVRHLLDAVTRIGNVAWRLTIVGTGPSEAELKRQAEASGIADRVEFAGYCTRNEVEAQYRRADIFVLPTDSDAFANVILEAMAAGLPVIASSVGGVAEAVVDGKTGLLVSPRNHQALAAAIERLATDAGMRREFGRAGRQRVRNLFAWNRIAERYVTAYTEATLPAVLRSRAD